MSNPITSVQDPSEKDPLSGIITQVSPTSAGAPSRGGPARPTKVYKSTTEKKKKKQQAEKVTPEAGTSKSASAGTAEKKEEEDSGAAKGLDPNTGIRTTDEQSEEQSHSQNPSSTLVGTTTTKGSNILGETDNTEGLSKDKPTDAAATPTEPDPTVGTISRQSGTQAVDGQKSSAKLTNGGSSAQKSVRGGGGQASNTPQTTRPVVGTTNTNRSKSKMDEQTSRAKSEKSSEQGKKEKKKGGSGGGKFVAALIAFLTCSMGSAAVAKESEEVNEKRGSGSREKASSSNNNSKMPISPSKNAPRSVGKGASNRNSFDKTAGGGTKLPREETGDVMSGAVVPPGSSFVVQDPDGKKSGGSSQKGGDDDDDDDDEEGGDDEWLGDDQLEDDEDQTEEQRLIMQGGVGIPRDEHGNLQPLLGPIHEQDKGRKCLVLDLDETLVHSSFKMISNADFTVPVEIEGSVHNVYVIKRPGVDEFMRRMGEIYEVVVFTASLSKYADPVLDILDIHHVVRHRLFRESCYNHRGNYVKDLSQLGRDIETSIIIDNSPASYIFHPNNAVPISSWFNDPHDTELTDLCPFLAELAEVEDVRAVLDGGL